MLIDSESLSFADLAINYNRVIIKHPTTSQMCRYTTLLNIDVGKL